MDSSSTVKIEQKTFSFLVTIFPSSCLFIVQRSFIKDNSPELIAAQPPLLLP